MRIDEIIAAGGDPVFSFEFFPPKTEEGEARLFAALEALRPLEPAFVSVTWGAGGSTRAKTIDIVSRIRANHDLEAMAHFTCVGATTDDLRGDVARMRDAGIENVLALRGDPPQGETTFVATEGGLSYSSELTALVGETYPEACLVGACYPEVHSEAADRESDLAHLKAKVDAGVRVLITQLFFDNAAYYRFVADARAAGIDVPIVPGIMPIISTAGIKRMTSLCGAKIPPALLAALEQRGDDAEAVAELGVAYATLQCAELLANGAPGIHFYTINRSPATRAILSALRLQRPWDASAGTEPALRVLAG
ncbi:methylenetetrahydrofolate reductase [NAD(P)H] [Conexibacter woesei]|uniref:Methylenetetrahydrofolate reductase n=1 Tax=Conexibacter woesei (strain DSM 14684 / CCUG 47730 / CIP 108061 / JCM 11494 / NBRC 100937 / ID131577) TaxID=469383 RepID=D3FCP0_CONWI|nr:methylenetetrahydrofolate reductase [NAD(P)H] [Conexibacter woesei]ADB49513.1 5,10-methylenetetrahydrofolate reductase [Conexibacter woesei DSM 14684]